MRERQKQVEVPFEKNLEHRVGQDYTFQNLVLTEDWD